MENKRENWGSRIGFIMAAAGSAVGLGNIWRFPYLAGENGGGAFIVIYLMFVVFIGFSIMLAEFTVGRKTGLAAVGAYKKINRSFTFAGVLGVLSAFFIMGFYPVVGGWATAYILKSFTGLLSDPAAIGDMFGAFIGNPVEPLIWMAIFLAINIVIVAKGISGGIEKAGKILMPTLFVLLILIAIRSVTLPGAGAGLDFLFKPDWSVVNGGTFLAALGQAFFSLSLGMGCMITYGSYLSKSENLPSSALTVSLMDTSVALLAGVAIFPALFAFGMEPAAGPGLVFVVVPQIFAQMGGLGPIFSAIFFIALMVAALTSSVSLLEVVVAYLMDERGWARKKSVYLSGAIMVVTGILSSLSLGVMSGFTLFGVGAFDFFDILTDKIFLAIGGLILAVFVGWFMDKNELKEEMTNGGAIKFGLFEFWYALVKFVIPIAIAIVAFFGITGIAQTSLMLFGLAVIAVLAIFSKKL
ncbi:sodium-dependent transporter [Gudongella oleilytica]|jgi:NSS family neurotransmitter:Na+ symporter|uniref:sodium-dependent transporter n=1 Tax=Gudongella oleilytica TaxID=1582259 RepID=UPI0013E8B568|nr:sodium-dependent transporter [Gudongella oleilytica]MDY0256377.1 sodium-dependent transporter [Gudongella oleilytica]